MKYINIDEVTTLLNKSKRRIQQMCQNNKIEGAIKKEGRWLIP